MSILNDHIAKRKLSNGVTVIVDRDPRFRTAAVSVSLVGGLRDERENSLGITHLLEHILFKQTERKNTREIACAIDDLGGDINAFTDADSLCLHGAVPAERLDDLIGFFGELLLENQLKEQDLALEKEVIRQEIIETVDDPGDAVYQRFAECFWPTSALRYPVYGTLEAIEACTVSDVQKRLAELLCGSRLLVAAAGPVDIDAVCRSVEALYAHLPQGERPAAPSGGEGTGLSFVHRPVNQVYVAWGTPWPSLSDDQFYPGLVCSALLGEGMSSRLFQRLREERGLAYDIESDVDSHVHTAALIISATVERKNVNTTLELVWEEMSKLRNSPVSDEEVQRNVRMLAGQLDMEVDSLAGRMWHAVESEIAFEEQTSIEEVRKQICGVSADAVRALIESRLPFEDSVLVLGGDVEDMSAESLSECCEGALSKYCVDSKSTTEVDEDGGVTAEGALSSEQVLSKETIH